MNNQMGNHTDSFSVFNETNRTNYAEISINLLLSGINKCNDYPAYQLVKMYK